MSYKTLNLTLNKKWFDMIASGEKKEEYREIKNYWFKRFFGACVKSTGAVNLSKDDVYSSIIHNIDLLDKPFNFDIVSANNGYSKGCPNVKWKHEGITIGEGNAEWGAEKGKKYFILKIGEIVSLDN